MESCTVNDISFYNFLPSSQLMDMVLNEYYMWNWLRVRNMGVYIVDHPWMQERFITIDNFYAKQLISINHYYKKMILISE